MTIVLSIHLSDEINEPKKMSDAWSGENPLEWKDATDAEYASLIQNKTWDLLPSPSGKKIFGAKWEFEVKITADSSVNRELKHLFSLDILSSINSANLHR